MTASDPPAVPRRSIVAYRAAVLGLAGTPGDAADALLDVGVQDHPTGFTARPALMLRDPGSTRRPDVRALVHGVRAATHLHHARDIGLLAAALRTEDARDFAKQNIGPFGAEIGAGFGAAIDEVSGTMRTVMSDGVARTKSELSGAVSPEVSSALAPWCERCGVHHVEDGLFRFASLSAGLAIEVESGSLWHFVAPVAVERIPVDDARAQLVRRFLHVVGPTRPQHVASWLGLTPRAAREWWSLVTGELEEVDVDGRRAWIHGGDAALLADPPVPDRLRLLGPYDPLTELADREFAVPDTAHRRQVWMPTGNPGIVVHHGEIAGIWRRRTARHLLTITVQPFGELPADWRELVTGDAATFARFLGARDVRLDVGG